MLKGKDGGGGNIFSVHLKIGKEGKVSQSEREGSFSFVVLIGIECDSPLGRIEKRFYNVRKVTGDEGERKNEDEGDECEVECGGEHIVVIGEGFPQGEEVRHVRYDVHSCPHITRKRKLDVVGCSYVVGRDNDDHAQCSIGRQWIFKDDDFEY